MFILQRDDFRAVDRDRLTEFVKCWEGYYLGSTPRENTEEPFDYVAELNLGHGLSEQNIIRLLRWKDQRWFTHPKREADGTETPNPRVQRVLEHLRSINNFRGGLLSDEQFEDVTQQVFRSGIVYRLFLFHIARPWQWPIADQNVFRSYSVLFNSAAPNSMKTFRAYQDRFQELAAEFRDSEGIEGGDLVKVVSANKRLDNALFAFGRFLAAFDY